MQSEYTEVDARFYERIAHEKLRFNAQCLNRAHEYNSTGNPVLSDLMYEYASEAAQAATECFALARELRLDGEKHA